ncbi:MerR family DNA-binding protein, partial [Enterococcus faecalis]|uniref:MerR family DNA-binding protein n=2 Tax=Enterococcus faecalis TaxID=1351 RepID=UPI001CCAC648
IIGNPRLNHRYRKGFYSLFKTLQQNRIFNDDDLSKLQMIKNFKMIGTPLEEIKRFFSLFEERNSKEKRLEFLLHEKNKIDEQIKSIQDGKEFLDSIIKECYM